MNQHDSVEAAVWRPTWTQAMTDFRGDDDEPLFDDVTVRMMVPASLAGSALRAELSNRFGDGPVRIGRGAIGVGREFFEITFGGEPSVQIPAGESRWTDPVQITVPHGDEITTDLYLSEPTAYATAAGFTFDRSIPGDFVGLREFPAAKTGVLSEPDGTGWSLPAGGPFLRTLEVAGAEASAVIVALGGSSTAMGWPQYTAAMLPADARIAVVNRGVSGNRIRLDAPLATPSWGRAGLSRFDEDVLGTAGVTHVVIAYNSNDWILPGRITTLDEMPSVAQMIDAYQELVDRSRAVGLHVVLATITPLGPEARADPARLEAGYAAPDDTHPNVNGEMCLARTMVQALARLGFPTGMRKGG